MSNGAEKADETDEEMDKEAVAADDDDGDDAKSGMADKTSGRDTASSEETEEVETAACGEGDAIAGDDGTDRKTVKETGDSKTLQENDEQVDLKNDQNNNDAEAAIKTAAQTQESEKVAVPDNVNI